MRTTVEENRKLGEVIAEKLNKAKSTTVLMLPLKGVSHNDKVSRFTAPRKIRSSSIPCAATLAQTSNSSKWITT